MLRGGSHLQSDGEQTRKASPQQARPRHTERQQQQQQQQQQHRPGFLTVLAYYRLLIDLLEQHFCHESKQENLSGCMLSQSSELMIGNKSEFAWKPRLFWQFWLALVLDNGKSVSSEAVEAELEKMSNLERLENIFKLLELATITVSLDQNIDQRSQELENLGEGLYDSFHIACAEVERVDVLLTTDDRLLKRATRYRDILQVTLNNPVTWLMDIFQEGGEQNHDTN